MGYKTSERIDQNRLTGNQGRYGLHQFSTGFSNSPVLGPTLSMCIETLLPVKVIRTGGCRCDVGDDGVVVQKMLSPPALAAAGWAADQDQLAVGTRDGLVKTCLGINHRHSSLSGLQQRTEKPG